MSEEEEQTKPPYESYFKLHLHKRRHAKLIRWLCDEKHLMETTGQAMRRKMYRVMQKENRSTVRHLDKKEPIRRGEVKG